MDQLKRSLCYSGSIALFLLVISSLLWTNSVLTYQYLWMLINAGKITGTSKMQSILPDDNLQLWCEDFVEDLFPVSTRRGAWYHSANVKISCSNKGLFVLLDFECDFKMNTNRLSTQVIIEYHCDLKVVKRKMFRIQFLPEHGFQQNVLLDVASKCGNFNHVSVSLFNFFKEEEIRMREICVYELG